MRRMLGMGVQGLLVQGLMNRGQKSGASWLSRAALVAALGVGAIALACGPSKTDAPPATPTEDGTAAGGAPAASAATPSTDAAGGSANAPDAPAADAPMADAPASAAPEVPVAPAEPPKETATPPKESKKPATPKAAAPKEEPKAAAPKEEPPKADPGFEPCLAKSFEFSQVRAACSSGGVKQAKGLMKQWTDKAKAAGNELKCTSCHTSTKTYALKGNAAADLRALLK